MEDELKTFLTFDDGEISVTRHVGQLEIISAHPKPLTVEETEELYKSENNQP